jgi:hypothetical protein
MNQKENKDQILIAFGKLLSEYKQAESRVATKEEEVEKEKNQALLERATAYTIDNIVNTMASLQLGFGRGISELSETLVRESDKLEELRRAITVTKEKLAYLQKVRIVADALYILRQEHQEKVRILEEQIAQQKEAIEIEMANSRKAWEKEQQEFDQQALEVAELTTKLREKEQTEYQYQLERQHKIETDEYENTQRQQERELQESNREKEKGWTSREQTLTANNAQFLENQQKIAGFEEKLKQEYTKAKGEAIKDAEREAKVKSDLFEKDWELAKQGYELNVQALEAQIQRNTEEIANLITQLQTATTQAQNLALRAFQGNSTGN